jgi:hypothetical protein
MFLHIAIYGDPGGDCEPIRPSWSRGRGAILRSSARRHFSLLAARSAASVPVRFPHYGNRESRRHGRHQASDWKNLHRVIDGQTRNHRVEGPIWTFESTSPPPAIAGQLQTRDGWGRGDRAAESRTVIWIQPGLQLGRLGKSPFTSFLQATCLLFMHPARRMASSSRFHSFDGRLDCPWGPDTGETSASLCDEARARILLLRAELSAATRQRSSRAAEAFS